MTGPEPVEVLVRRLDPGLPLPSYAHPGDAGADLVTAVDAVVQPGERAVLPTGIALALPAGHAAFVHPRSGLAARYGVSLVNAPGTVDAGYRGEVKVILVNLDAREPVTLRRGDRVAQLVVQRVEVAAFREVPELPASARGGGGLGSTGGYSGAAGPAAPGSTAVGSAVGSAAGGSAAPAAHSPDHRTAAGASGATDAEPGADAPGGE